MSISTYEPGLDLGDARHAAADVVGAGAAGRDDLAGSPASRIDGGRRRAPHRALAVRASRSARSRSGCTCPSYPITPRSVEAGRRSDARRQRHRFVARRYATTPLTHIHIDQHADASRRLCARPPPAASMPAIESTATVIATSPGQRRDTRALVGAHDFVGDQTGRHREPRPPRLRRQWRR